MPTLTPEQQALKQAALAATQGPWIAIRGDGELDLKARWPTEDRVLVMADDDCPHHPIADCSANSSCRLSCEQEVNADFIAAANPSAILALLAQIEAIPEQWRPIDTAPKDLRSVWLGCPSSIRVGFWSDGQEYEHHGSIGGGWRDLETGRDLHFAPTSWMPVPRVPGSQA